MPRPPRLKSELDAASPVTARPHSDPTLPPPHTRNAPTAPTAPPMPLAGPQDDTLPQTVASETKYPKPAKSRVGPYLTAEQADRLRACYVNGWLQDHRGTFSDMLETLLLAGAEQIEQAKNGGQPWRPINAGAIKSISQMNIEAERRISSV